MLAPVKEFQTYDEQVDLLLGRGMLIERREEAVDTLRRVNYYRLSGYWYPFRELADVGGRSRRDSFYPGTKFGDVVKLYEFDARLRTASFDALAPVELAVRSALGHALGEIDACAHLKPELLNARPKVASTDCGWLAIPRNLDAPARTSSLTTRLGTAACSPYGPPWRFWIGVA